MAITRHFSSSLLDTPRNMSDTIFGMSALDMCLAQTWYPRDASALLSISGFLDSTNGGSYPWRGKMIPAVNNIHMHCNSAIL